MKSAPRIQAGLLGAGGLLAIALLAGRASGLAREVLLAATFGVSLQADVAVLLLTVPDLLVNILLAGGLSAALVPRLRGKSDQAAGQLFRRTGGWVVAAFSLIGVFVVAAPEALFAILAPGLPGPTRIVAGTAILMVALSIPLTALSGVSTAYLNAKDKFFVAGTGTLIFNLVVISSLLFLPAVNGLLGLTVAIFAGATIRLLSQVVVLPRSAFDFRGGWGTKDRAFALAFAAGIAASSFTLLPSILLRAGASLLGTGNVALFNYAQKLVELPVGILITTISTVALTRLSSQFAEGQEREARQTLVSAVRMALFLAIFVVIFGGLAADEAASLVFLRGAIVDHEVRQIAILFKIALCGVPFVAFSSLAAAALNAQLRTTQVFRATAISVALLPICALPGLYFSSATLLMAALVGSQAVLAWLLARRAELRLLGSGGVISRQTGLALGTGLMIAAIPVLLIFLAPFQNDLFTLALCALGFIAAVATSLLISKEWARVR